MMSIQVLKRGTANPLIVVFIHSHHASSTFHDKESEGGLYSICFSPNGNHLVTTGEDKQIRVGILSTPSPRSEFAVILISRPSFHVYQLKILNMEQLGLEY